MKKIKCSTKYLISTLFRLYWFPLHFIDTFLHTHRNTLRTITNSNQIKRSSKITPFCYLLHLRHLCLCADMVFLLFFVLKKMKTIRRILVSKREHRDKQMYYIMYVECTARVTSRIAIPHNTCPKMWLKFDRIWTPIWWKPTVRFNRYTKLKIGKPKSRCRR